MELGISRRHQAFMCVRVEGVTIALQVMWFGITHGPQAWVSRASVPYDFFSAAGSACTLVLLVIYMDDLATNFNPDAIPREPIVFTPAWDAFLRS